MHEMLDEQPKQLEEDAALVQQLLLRMRRIVALYEEFGNVLAVMRGIGSGPSVEQELLLTMQQELLRVETLVHGSALPDMMLQSTVKQEINDTPEPASGCSSSSSTSTVDATAPAADDCTNKPYPTYHTHGIDGMNTEELVEEYEAQQYPWCPQGNHDTTNVAEQRPVASSTASASASAASKSSSSISPHVERPAYRHAVARVCTLSGAMTQPVPPPAASNSSAY